MSDKPALEIDISKLVLHKCVIPVREEPLVANSKTVNGVRTICMEDTYYARKINETRQQDRKNRKPAKNYISGASLSSAAW